MSTANYQTHEEVHRMLRQDQQQQNYNHLMTAPMTVYNLRQISPLDYPVEVTEIQGALYELLTLAGAQSTADKIAMAKRLGDEVRFGPRCANAVPVARRIYIQVFCD